MGRELLVGLSTTGKHVAVFVIRVGLPSVVSRKWMVLSWIHHPPGVPG